MPQQNWKALQKKILEKAEKGDNQHRGKKNNQDLETTRRSYATRRLKMIENKICQKYFSYSEEMVLSFTHCSLEVWEKFCQV